MTEIILTPLYEPVFLGFNYGFRPGRGAHDALDALAVAIDRRKVNWVVDCDIRKFFDSVSRAAAAWRLRPSRPPATGRSVSGKPCARSTGRRASSAGWVHKTANVLKQAPEVVQPRARQHLQDIWMAETRAVAEKAFDFFLEADGSKYDKAVACLAKDRAVLLAFYDFPAEHWKHIRTTNPIESTFATVRFRTTKTKGCLSRMTALTMVFKPCQSAGKKWRRLDGSHQIAGIIQGVKFKDGEKLTERAA